MFLFFFDELKNLHNRILGNQKLELLRINCQWNCMYKKDAQGCIKSTGTAEVEILLYRHLNWCKIDFELVYLIVTSLNLDINARYQRSGERNILVNMRKPLNVPQLVLQSDKKESELG